MTGLLSLLFFTTFTLGAMRVVAARATLGPGTMLRYVVLGMLLGPLAVVPAHRLLDPYGLLAGSTWVQFISEALTLLILLAPVLVFLFVRRAWVVLSIADAFLLAFAVGLGYDLLGWLLQAGAGQDPLVAMKWLPPAVFEPAGAGGPTIASTGYLLALVTLGLVSAHRFGLGRASRRTVASIVFVLVAVSRLAPAWSTAEEGYASRAGGIVATLTFDGALIPWIAFVLVVLLQWRESRWITVDDAAGPVRLFSEWKRQLEALVDREFGRLRRLTEAYGLRRQTEIALAESRRRPADAFVQRLARHVGSLARSAIRAAEAYREAGATGSAGSESETGPVAWWVDRPWIPALAVWVAFFGIFVLPGAFATLASLALAALLVWWFVSSPAKAAPGPTPDRMIRFQSESWILAAGLVAAAITILGAAPGQLTWPIVTQLPEDPRLVLLLLATAACALTLPTRRTWRARPAGERRPVMVRRGLVAAQTAILVGGTVWVYTRGLTALHEKYGDVFFYMSDRAAERPPDLDLPFWAAALTFEQPPPFGNTIPAWFMALAAGLFALLVGLALRAATRPLETTYADAAQRGTVSSGPTDARS